MLYYLTDENHNSKSLEHRSPYFCRDRNEQTGRLGIKSWQHMEKCAFARTIKANHTGQCQLYLGIELAIGRILYLFVNAIYISYANAKDIIEMSTLGSVLVVSLTQLSTLFFHTP